MTTDLTQLAQQCGATIYRHRLTPQSPALAFGDEAWARFCAQLQAQAKVIGWINEDELPENYPYDVMFPHSKVDGVRLFPVFAPAQQKGAPG